MTESPQHLGERIKQFREEDLQLSQTDLAWLASVSRGTVSNVETGRVTPDERTWQRMRTAMGWMRTVANGDGPGKPVPLLMPADVVQGIVQAILAIRDQDLEVGARTAERWRRLVSSLTRDDTDPDDEVRAELAWLARDVALKAPPERIPAIHKALQEYGLMQNLEVRAESQATVSSDAQDLRRAIAPVTFAVNQLNVQIKDLREQTRGFERLPIRVQELLHHGIVADSETYQPSDTPGLTIVDLIILDENATALVPRRSMLATTRRWGVILLVAKYIAEELAPDRNPEEILEAVERSLLPISAE